MIDWTSLATETWATAKARRKLEHLMLIFYEWHPLLPLGRFQTLVAGLWEPDAATLAMIEQDWLTIQRLAIEGRRSRSQREPNPALGAATKGAGHGSISRAWSLKQPFVGWIYRAMAGSSPPPPRTVALDPEQEFERGISARFASIEGKTIAQVATLLGISAGERQVVRRASHPGLCGREGARAVWRVRPIRHRTQDGPTRREGPTRRVDVVSELRP